MSTAIDPLVTFPEAIRHYSRNEFEQARRICLALLRKNRRDSDAWHMLGSLAHQRNKTRCGMVWVEKAIWLNPKNPLFFNTLGILRQAVEDMEGAEKALRQALQLNPASVEVLTNLGLLMLRSARLQEAIEIYQAALKQRPDLHGVWLNLGLAHRNTGALQEALSCFTEAIRHQPDYVLAHYNQGVLLHDLHRYEEALAPLQRVLEIQPGLMNAYHYLGLSLIRLGRYAEAQEWLEKALLHPSVSPDIYNNLAGLYKDSAPPARLEEAIACYEKALDLAPDAPETLTNYALALMTLGRVQEALPCYERALQATPDYPMARFGRGLWHLIQGDYSKGWPDYESRVRLESFNTAPIQRPPWDGQSLSAGRRLLVSAEQGFGDNLQFIRYLPLLKAQYPDTEIVYACLEAQLRLFQNYPGIDRFITGERESQLTHPEDQWCYVMSLPHLLKTEVSSIPPVVDPAQWCNPAWREQFSTRISGEGLKIGLVWSSKAGNYTTKMRSCPLALLDRLADIPNLQFYSLQKGNGVDQLAHSALSVIDLSEGLNDFADTAGAIACLDLVITVDTAVAHLAASLNKPTWVLLHYFPDWRWMRERSDSPWYPTARLFRQSVRDEWSTVIDDIHETLNQTNILESLR